MKQLNTLIILSLLLLVNFVNGQSPPELTVNVNTSPSPGYIFLSNFVLSNDVQTDPHLLIIDNNGGIAYQKYLTSSINTDFKWNSGNFYTYFNMTKGKFYKMNDKFEVVDSFYAVNGKATNLHELRFLDDGGYILLTIQNKNVNMSRIVRGGSPNATILDNGIQRFNSNKELVFEWDALEHLNITDATDDIDLTAPIIDCFHFNAIEIDFDGNILLSVRHFDEIIKIDSQTGDIIWILGGSKSKNNQFVFTNDKDENGFVGFSHQHAIRKLPNGNYTLFDNGNLKNPQYSRAIEFSLDQETKTFTKVWEYRPNPDVYSSAMGYVQRLENGNTIIGWGENLFGKTVTEVDSNGKIVFDLSFPAQVYSYRAYRFDVNISAVVQNKIELNNFELYQNYPNPLFCKEGKAGTTIRYSIGTRMGRNNSNTSYRVSLDIYDVLGKKVATLKDEHQPAGTYFVNFRPNNLAEGIYFYTLRVGNFTKTKKLLIIK